MLLAGIEQTEDAPVNSALRVRRSMLVPARWIGSRGGATKAAAEYRDRERAIHPQHIPRSRRRRASGPGYAWRRRRAAFRTSLQLSDDLRMPPSQVPQKANLGAVSVTILQLLPLKNPVPACQHKENGGS